MYIYIYIFVIVTKGDCTEENVFTNFNEEMLYRRQVQKSLT